MPLQIALVVPRRQFIANRVGLGYQVPLGLVFVGGVLIEAGHRVTLIDNDVLGLGEDVLARRLAAPRALLRLAFAADRAFRRILWAYYLVGARVFVAELVEFFCATRFVRPGRVRALLGFERQREPHARREPAQCSS